MWYRSDDRGKISCNTINTFSHNYVSIDKIRSSYAFIFRLDEEEELEKEVTKLEAQIEKELEERKGKLRGPYAKLAR